MKLHYLAVDDRFRGKDYGEFLLGEVFSIAKNVQRISGCNFITVEALNPSTNFYKDRGFEYLNYDMDKKKEF
ncbi:GNAT family N-acetyltransferase [Ammoniphilus sp. 3BR4]|uniref:GNAT family N-acetyltransferase n=1 Tax=Ammoniphilus sp. 3BR4 TaxID=3158265 RepID=UPI003467C495